MTIGVGFVCEDGVVLCSDNQITYPTNHKYYECKIYPHSIPGGRIAFTFAGNPNVMKMFDGKFKAAIQMAPTPHTASQIQDAVETVLGLMDIVDSDPDGLHMLCAIALQTPEVRLLKTERKAVTEVPKFDYVGVGDSSLLRYLAPLMAQPDSYTCDQAIGLGVCLVLQAKRYIDGCGGDTDVAILRGNQKDNLRFRSGHSMEQVFLRLEQLLNRVVTDLFDIRKTTDEFGESVEHLAKALKGYRPSIMSRTFPPF